jgi:hypothetical protein
MGEQAAFGETDADYFFRSKYQMRMFVPALFAALVAGLAIAAPAPAQDQASPEMATAAKAIQGSCVKRGEDSRVCACSVGLAYAKLDPKVFKIMPEVEPLLDNKNQAAATLQLLSLASSNGIGVSDLQAAYQTIRDNRATVRQICKPLSAKAG